MPLLNRNVTLILTMLMVALGAMSQELSSDNHKLLRRLDEAIAKREVYIEARQGRIDSLKSLLKASSAPGARLKLSEQIADTYYNFQIDSALTWFKHTSALASTVADSVTAERARIKYISLMPVAGALREGINEFEKINVNDIARENLFCYYAYGSQLYFFAIDYYSAFPALRKEYGAKAMALTSNIPDNTPEGSNAQAYYRELKQLANPKGAAISVANLTDLFEGMSPDERYYSRTAMALRHYYSALGDNDKELNYLIHAALSDLLSGTREESALLTLGEELYERGDVDHAYTYLNLALENAVESGAASRIMEGARHLPTIMDAASRKVDHKVTFMWILILALLAALSCIGFILIRHRRERDHLKALKDELSKANELKEHYIADFINLLSSHLEQVDDFNRFAIRKIKAQQVDGLLSELTGNKVKGNTLKTFYEIFDNAFLNMYPHFIEDVNRLLIPEKLSYDVNARRLSNDLRILAFMKLGIDDGNRIARFLGVSVNTIYTYRNKFRAAAKRRDTFEADILSLRHLVDA